MLYSYIVTDDTGFAPNPFHGVCTLVCCSPRLRKYVPEGAWIAGLTPKADGHKLVYAMKVGEKIEMGKYWSDPAYQSKRADDSTPQRRCGDNIYEPLGKDTWRQHASFHSRECLGSEEAWAKQFKKDICGGYALIASEFVYYGASAITLPEPLASTLPVGRGYRCNFSQDILTAWEEFIQNQPRGLQDNPGDWNKEGCGGCSPAIPQSFADREIIC